MSGQFSVLIISTVLHAALFIAHHLSVETKRLLYHFVMLGVLLYDMEINFLPVRSWLDTNHCHSITDHSKSGFFIA